MAGQVAQMTAGDGDGQRLLVPVCGAGADPASFTTTSIRGPTTIRTRTPTTPATTITTTPVGLQDHQSIAATTAQPHTQISSQPSLTPPIRQAAGLGRESKRPFTRRRGSSSSDLDSNTDLEARPERRKEIFRTRTFGILAVTIVGAAVIAVANVYIVLACYLPSIGYFDYPIPRQPFGGLEGVCVNTADTITAANAGVDTASKVNAGQAPIVGEWRPKPIPKAELEQDAKHYQGYADDDNNNNNNKDDDDDDDDYYSGNQDKSEDTTMNGIPFPPGADAGDLGLPVVRLGQGTYVGLAIEPESINAPDPAAGAPTTQDPQQGQQHGAPYKVHGWRGIPFARTERFRPPTRLDIPAVKWGEDAPIYSAWRLGPRCPNWVDSEVAEGEDCLNLSVYAAVPADTQAGTGSGSGSGSSSNKTLHPVVIYVHGGAFNSGSGAGRNLVSMVSWSESPIVAVSFNYRVGPLGFPTSPFMAKHGLLNLGLRDMMAAFEWVRENIEHFGGDKNRVTIMGISAGSHGIGHLLSYYSSPSSSSSSSLQGGQPAPFHRAILESGTSVARATYAFNHPRHVHQWDEFLAFLGLKDVPEEQLLDKLRAIPVSTLAMAGRKVWDNYSYGLQWPFQPAIEPTHSELAGLGVEATILDPLSPLDSAANGARNDYSPGYATDTNHVDINGDAVSWSLDGKTYIPGLTDRVIPAPPIDLLSSPSRIQIPILAGFQNNEASGFIPHDDSSLTPYISALLPGFEASDLDEMEKVYGPEGRSGDDDKDHRRGPPRYAHPPPAERVGPEWPRMEAAYAHYAYICPVLLMGHWWDRTWEQKVSGSNMLLVNQEQQQQYHEQKLLDGHPDVIGGGNTNAAGDYSGGGGGSAPVYIYRFAALNAPFVTAGHGDNAVFVSHDPSVADIPGLQDLTTVMSAYWTRFIASETGDPNESPRLPLVSSSSSGPSSSIPYPVTTELPVWPRFKTPFSSVLQDGEPGSGARMEEKVEEGDGNNGGQGFVEWGLLRKDGDNYQGVDDGGDGGGELGNVMVFGLGNDIQAGGQNIGASAQAGRLDNWDKIQCLFWFPRVRLSEGMGRRE